MGKLVTENYVKRSGSARGDYRGKPRLGAAGHKISCDDFLALNTARFVSLIGSGVSRKSDLSVGYSSSVSVHSDRIERIAGYGMLATRMN